VSDGHADIAAAKAVQLDIANQPAHDGMT